MKRDWESFRHRHRETESAPFASLSKGIKYFFISYYNKSKEYLKVVKILPDPLPQFIRPTPTIYQKSWVPKKWCFWTVVLEKTLESPLDCKEIQPVHPKGNQSWIFIGRTDAEAETPILWPPHVKSWLIWKDRDVGKDWRQEGDDRGWHG